PNGGKWQITAQGGVEPKWRRDGHELYYLALDGKLMAVSIKGDRTLGAGTPASLFETPLTVNRTQPDRTRRYDVAPDGRFLIAMRSTGLKNNCGVSGTPTSSGNGSCRPADPLKTSTPQRSGQSHPERCTSSPLTWTAEAPARPPTTTAPAAQSCSNWRACWEC